MPKKSQQPTEPRKTKPVPSLNFTGHQNADLVQVPELPLHYEDRFRTGKHRIAIAAFDPYGASVTFNFDAGIIHFRGDGRFAR